MNAPNRLTLSSVLSRPVVCRVAPSPTGHFHVGTARCAWHNWLAARASGGKFILRIDDTDKSRNDQAHVDLIFSCMKRLGLDWDSTFHQSSRAAAHVAAADSLLSKGLAFVSDGAVRLNPIALPDSFYDLASGRCSISGTGANQAADLVILRSDGLPTYHFASVVDDVDCGVTLVLRGADHLSNVPKHLAIARALKSAGHPGAGDFVSGMQMAHVGLITKDGKKVSKRDGGSNFADLLDAGTDPDALLHWLLRLGWGHPDSGFDKTHPRMDKATAASLFAMGRLRSVNCNLDFGKLASLNAAYGKAAPVDSRGGQSSPPAP